MFTFQLPSIIPRTIEVIKAYVGLIGLVVGGLVSALYGLVTLWPGFSTFPDGLIMVIFIASLLAGMAALRQPSGYWRDDNFEVEDPGPGPFSYGLGLAMIPIWAGTIVYAVGNWFGVWGFLGRVF